MSYADCLALFINKMNSDESNFESKQISFKISDGENNITHCFVAYYHEVICANHSSFVYYDMVPILFVHADESNIQPKPIS